MRALIALLVTACTSASTEPTPEGLRRAARNALQTEAAASHVLVDTREGWLAHSAALEQPAQLTATSWALVTLSGEAPSPLPRDTRLSTTLQVDRWGREGALVQPEPHFEVNGAVARWRRGGLVEEVRNGPLGLSHTLTVDQPPAGEGELTVHLTVAGADVVVRDPTRAVIQHPSGKSWIYDGLAAFDADGVLLPAQLVDDVDGLTLRVDDRGARYPVEIDPLVADQRQVGTAFDFGEAAGLRFGAAIARARIETGATGDVQEYLFVGAPGANNGAGRIYSYMLQVDTWIPESKFEGSGTDAYGSTLCANEDRLFIGRPGADAGVGRVSVVEPWRWLPSDRVTFRSQGDLRGTTAFGAGFGAALSCDRYLAAQSSTPPAGAANPPLVMYRRTDTNPDTWLADPSVSGTTPEWGASFSTSGDYLLVGDPGHDGLSFDEGRALIYDRDTAGRWPLAQTLTNPNPAFAGRFGASVALSSADGWIGAPGAPSGGVVLPIRNDGANWRLRAAIPAPAGEGRFGSSLAVYDGHLTVLAPDTASGSTAYVWPIDDTSGPPESTWQLSGTTVPGVCSHAVMCDPLFDTPTYADTGRVWMFSADNGNAGPQPVVPFTTPLTGSGVSILSGDHAIISGNLPITYRDGWWQRETRIAPPFLTSAGGERAGHLLVLSGVGGASVWERQGDAWVDLWDLPDTPSVRSDFGVRDTSDRSDRVILAESIGSQLGVVDFVEYARSGDTFVEVTRFPSPDPSCGGNAHDDVLVLRAPLLEAFGGRAGRVWIYERDASGWRETAALYNPDPLYGFEFGSGGAWVGADEIILSWRSEAPAPEPGGHIGVWRRDGGTWVFAHELRSADIRTGSSAYGLGRQGDLLGIRGDTHVGWFDQVGGTWEQIGSEEVDPTSDSPGGGPDAGDGVWSGFGTSLGAVFLHRSEVAEIQVDLDDQDPLVTDRLATTFVEGGGALAVAPNAARVTNQGPTATLVARLFDARDGDAETVTFNNGGWGTPEVIAPHASRVPSLAWRDIGAVLRALRYRHTGSNAQEGTRTIDIVFQGALIARIEVDVRGVNDAPVVDLDGLSDATSWTAPFAEGDLPVPIADASGATVTDPDDRVIDEVRVVAARGLEWPVEDLAWSNLPGIAVDWQPEIGRMRLVGPASTAAFTGVLRSIRYQNLSETPGSRDLVFTVTARDADGDGAPATSTIDLSADRDTPSVTVGHDGQLDHAVAWIEDGPDAWVVSPDVSVTWVEGQDLTDLYVEISRPPDGVDEVFLIDAPRGFSVNASAGGLSVDGSGSAEVWQAMLATLRYRNLREEPTSGAREVSIRVGQGVLLSPAATVRLDVRSVDDPVSADLNGTRPGVDVSATWREGDPPLAVTDRGAQLADPDSPVGAVGAVAIALVGAVDPAERLDLSVEPAGLTVVRSPDGLRIDATGAAATATWNNLLRNLRYTNGGDAPTVGARSITVTVDVGPPSTATIEVVPENDAPRLDLDADAPGTSTMVAWTEGDPAVAIAPRASLDDPDDALLASVTMRARTGSRSPTVRLDVPTIDGVTVTRSDGVLTLEGPTTVAVMADALRLVTWHDAGDAPADATIEVEVADPQGGVAISQVDVHVTPVNDPPALHVDGDGNTARADVWIEAAPPVLLLPDAQLTDPDDAAIAGLTVRWTPLDGVDERLVAAGGSALTTDAPGLWSLAGPMAIDAAEAWLRSVAFEDVAVQPTDGTRALSVEVRDPSGLIATVTVAVEVSGRSDDPPSLDLDPAAPGVDGVAAWSEGELPILVAPEATIADVDDGTLDRAELTVTGASRLFLDGDALPTTWGDQRLVLLGPAPVSRFVEALRAVRWVDEAEDPAEVAEVRVVVWDPAGLTAEATWSVAVRPVNDPPLLRIDATGATQATVGFTEGDTGAFLAPEALVSDPDDGALRMEVSWAPVDADEALDGPVSADAPGSWSMPAMATADVEAALRALVWVGSEQPTPGPRVVTVRVIDAGGASAAVEVTVQVVAVDDPPVLDLDDASPGVDARAVFADAPVALAPSPTVADPDDETFTHMTVVVEGMVDPGEAVAATAPPGVVAQWDAGTGTLALSGEAPLDAWADALTSLRYDNPAVPRTVGTRVARVTIGNAADATAIATIEIPPALPVIDLDAGAGVDGVVAWTEGDPPVVLAADATLAHPTGAVLEDVVCTLATDPLGSWSAVPAGAVRVGGSPEAITLQGPAPLADVEATLRTLTWSTTDDAPPTSHVVTCTARDVPGAVSSAQVTIAITGVDDPPSVQVTPVATPISAGLGPAALVAAAAVVDPDDDRATGLRVTLVEGSPARHRLALATPGGRRVEADAAGVLVADEAAPLDAWADAIEGLELTVDQVRLAEEPVSVTIEVTSGGATSGPVTLLFTVVGTPLDTAEDVRDSDAPDTDASETDAPDTDREDPDPVTPDPEKDGGCGCASTSGRSSGVWLLALFALLRRARSPGVIVSRFAPRSLPSAPGGSHA